MITVAVGRAAASGLGATKDALQRAYEDLELWELVKDKPSGKGGRTTGGRAADSQEVPAAQGCTSTRIPTSSNGWRPYQPRLALSLIPT